MVQAASSGSASLGVRGEVVREDGRFGDELDDFVGKVVGEGGVAELQGVGGWATAVDLGCGVGEGAGVDAPGTDAERAVRAVRVLW